MPEVPLETWEVWYPAAAATGMYFARSRVDPAGAAWIHSAPPVVAVTVRRGDGEVVARGRELKRTGEWFPMTRLEKRGDIIVREDRWPTEQDVNDLVILPGGEAGRLLSWWNAVDGSEWRWRMEFYNHR